MKYKLLRKDFMFLKHDIYIIPTVRLYINDLHLGEPNFAIQFHWLVWHCRLLFLKGE